MIAEVALGLVSLVLALLLYKQGVDAREERRLLMNRELAKSVPELTALQIATKPTRGDLVQAIKNGHPMEPEEREPKRPSIPFGL